MSSSIGLMEDSLKTPEKKWSEGKHKQRGDAIYFSREMLESLAYCSLRLPASYVVLAAFLAKRRVQHERRPCTREYSWIVTNNGQIEFTYAEAKDKWRLSDSKFRRAIDDLIRVGFIDIAESGYGRQKKKTLYAISDRWKQFGTSGFREKRRDKLSQGAGFKRGNRLGRNAKARDFHQLPATVEPQLPTTVENSWPFAETALAGTKTGVRSDGHNSCP
jgi:hypothetical protein